MILAIASDQLKIATSAFGLSVVFMVCSYLEDLEWGTQTNPPNLSMHFTKLLQSNCEFLMGNLLWKVTRTQ